MSYYSDVVSVLFFFPSTFLLPGAFLHDITVTPGAHPYSPDDCRRGHLEVKCDGPGTYVQQLLPLFVAILWFLGKLKRKKKNRVSDSMTLDIPEALSEKIAQSLSGVEQPYEVSCKFFGATPGNEDKPRAIIIQGSIPQPGRRHSN